MGHTGSPWGKTLALRNEEAERIFIPLPCVCACVRVTAVEERLLSR